MTWIECVPNFSEGRDPTTIDALADALRSVADVYLLDVHRDASHHRSVFTVAGPPDGVARAIMRAVEVAVDRIDLRGHKGVHPRVGAVDVIPFVPLENSSLEECVHLARRVGADLADRFALPVFFYGHAARDPRARTLAELRRNGIDGLADAKGLLVRPPDRGPPRLHPTAGVAAVGARPFLVAFNVFLDTDDRSVAADIARVLRESSGGLPGVQAKGFRVDGRAQVSMNLTDLDRITPAAVVRAVADAGRQRGVSIAWSEIVGLIPERALRGTDAQALRLRSNLSAHVLEWRLREVTGRAPGTLAPPS